MKPVVLIILDGWGYSKNQRGNAVLMAKTPTLDTIRKNFPFALLQASGISVGLPWDEAGNSEVGHKSMGTGQVIYQPLTRISRDIQSGNFFTNKAFLSAVEHTKKFNSSLHIMGLLGSGSVHSYLDHLWALLELAKKENVERVYLHLFLDGRDSGQKEGASLIGEVIKKTEGSVGSISSIIGRHYAMDRDQIWENIAKTYSLMTEGKGINTKNPIESIKEQYAKKITDEYIKPLRTKEGEEGLVGRNDALIYFNFREDRARELTHAFKDPAGTLGLGKEKIDNLFLVTMSDYERGLNKNIAYPPVQVRYTLSELISSSGKTQFKIAEAEKSAHVTYFFNGGKQNLIRGEKQKIIMSEKVEDFITTPQMKTPEITQELITAIKSGEYNFLLANFANADMLGHTGNMDAAIKGIEVIDESIGLVLKVILKLGGTLVITADHGNAEQMLNIKSGTRLSQHSKNPVPFWLVGKEFKKDIIEMDEPEITGILPDITATLLELLEIPIPPDMDGKSLLPK